MILVDTSVWIRFLSNQSPYAARLDAILDRGETSGHELIRRTSHRRPGGRAKFLASYAKMHQARMVPNNEVVAFVRDRNLHGRGLGWVDIHLLAAAVVEGLRLWTADPRFARVAKELGVAWE
jgi:predicted nucleic acid-binding protein